MTVGLVLGGGGARGTFEIGALNCLFTQFAIEPTIISGCSAGALIAAKLAEGRTLAHFVEATVALRDFVLSLTRDEIFVKQPWFQSLDHTSLGATFESMFKHRPHEAAHHLHHTHGFAGMLALELVQFLPRAPAAIQELRRHSSSLLSIAPFGARIRGGPGRPGFLHPDRIASSGIRLRITTVSLETGEARYVTESGAIVHDDDQRCVSSPTEPVDLVTAVLASAAIPVLFEPVRLGTETYVDGGVRQCVPVEIAVRAGADRLFTIANTPLAAAQSPSTFVGANFLSILQRAYTVVSQHEILRSNLFAGGIGNVPNTVVMPTVYTHGLMEINPGLMLIGWDYGYLRAGDALRDLSPAVRARAMRYTDSIVLLRTEAWHVEETDLAPDGPSGAVERLRVYKWLTARLARSRAALGVPMPPEASRWWLEWERHECPLAPRTPWQEQAFESYVPSRVALKDPAGGTATIAGGVISAPGDDGRAEADGVLVVTVPPGAIEALREALGGA